ncbi:flagellar export protein FliJ [Undibacterium sp. LX40W]|uniref:Flagellar FliJ protein n=1 Tax=Undibacterium nitidum TaxID=2762298 RepID=A0A923KSH4_9BURK|nr:MULTISPECIES: flagellar export protein FliJ [Undibacterium]MBC3880307.1 flagellar export protein FliJ [Undibacterium nitidum]MBC3890957.1 flagellar export protein FliJ [Undibacterium sp. LX40W]
MVKSQLQTLIELAESELDVATKSLGRAVKAKDDADAQLTMLVQYRSDYEDKLQNHAQRGLNVAQFANFQAFIGKLDQAIEGQKKIIVDAEYRVKSATLHWQECEKKRLSYQVLIDKNQRQAQLKEAKRDQKQTDELATRTLFYKR